MPAIDNNPYAATSLESPADRHFAIVPSDTVDLAIIPRALFCQAAGTVVIRDADGTDLPYTLAQGQILPFRGRRILATGTSGTFYGQY